MATDLLPLIGDLAAESAVLLAILDPLTPAQCELATPADGWSIADQVSHLAYFDQTTLQSMTDPERFRIEAELLLAGGDDFADRVLASQRHRTSRDLLGWFRSARTALLRGYTDVDPTDRLPWYGLSMGVASSITARLMETWAHGQDIADTLGIVRPATARLRHIAHIGIRSLPYSFGVNGKPVPAEPIRVELTSPAGELWEWGPADAENRVAGEALDFCLLVTQRRHRSDTALTITGPIAGEWTAIAQAFAGPAGTGRAAGTPLSARAEPDRMD